MSVRERTVSHMSSRSAKRERGEQSTVGSAEFIHIRCTGPELRRRFKAMSANAGLSYHEYLTHLLDKEQSRLVRQRAQMPSPLHRPTAENLEEPPVAL